MQSFIGKPLKEVIEFCEKKELVYFVTFNTINQDNIEDLFVTNVINKDNKLEIVVSKFKIEV